MKPIIALLLALVLVLAGCRWDEPAYVPPGDLGTGTATEPDNSPLAPAELSMVYYPNQSLNPFQCTDYSNRALFSLIYQGLFAIDPNYEVHPMLCAGYDVSVDLRTWTFHIAQATFSDGSPVTAEDVRASLLASMGSAWYGGRLQHVQSISVLGSTVVVQLDTAFENLPILLDIPIVKATQIGDTHPLGTGPYRLDGQQLRRQAAWWCSATLATSAQTIPLVVGGAADFNRNEFEAHRMGLVCADPADADYADYRRDYELWNSENGLFVYLSVNKNSQLFKVDSIRSALTYAINRNALVSEFYHGLARGASLPASPQSPYYSDKLAANYDYEPELFTQAVAAAQAQGSAITLLVSSGDQVRTNVARQIADDLRSAGILVTVKTVPASELVSQLRWGTYDLFLGQTRMSANMDLSAFFHSNGSLNYGGLANPDMYQKCLDALTNSGNYYTLHKTVMEQGWLCPVLFQSYAIYGARGVVNGLTPARDNLFYYDLGTGLADIRIQ